MTLATQGHPVTAARLDLPLALRLALRELRGGVRGLGILIACVALGVAAITAVGGINDAMLAALDANGRTLLGGDVSVTRMHLRASEVERAWLAGLGEVSEVAALRGMARSAAGGEQRQALVEVKAVDAAYPLVGSLEVTGGKSLAQAIGMSGTAVADPLLLQRLGIAVGDHVRVGDADLTLTAAIAAEPDRLTSQSLYGPRLLMSLDTLEATGLVKPGALVRWSYRILGDGVALSRDGAATDFSRRLNAALPDNGFQVATRYEPVPGARRALGRLGQFLTLVGLTVLVIGGVGVANGVAAHMQRKRRNIAMLRSLGAGNAEVVAIYLLQILLLAGGGILCGLLLGSLVPPAVIALLGSTLPVTVVATASLPTLALAATYGLLVALLFVIWPLGRAEGIRAAELLREVEGKASSWLPPWRYIAVTLLISGLMAALLLLTAGDRWLALACCGGLVLLMALLLVAGLTLESLARLLPHSRSVEVRLAIGNIGGAQSLARPVMLSLGCGLGLLTAVALIDHSLERDLAEGVPANAPSYYLLDVPPAKLDELRGLFDGLAPGARLDTAPMLRGRILKVKDAPAETLHPRPEHEWALQGDRGLSFAAEPPPGTEIVAGSWWPSDYSGPPLVSFDAELARGLGLAVGDSITVSVLGRPMQARIASLRRIAWGQLGMNFVMIFSPSALKGAPHTLVATATYASPPGIESEAKLLQAVATAMPDVALLRVKDALEMAAGLLAKVLTAVRVVAATTLLIGAIVISGALAAARRRRSHQAVLLKVLGATSKRILAASLIEHVILATAASLVAIVVGGLSAWLIVRYAIEVPFAWSSFAVLQAAGVSLILVLVIGGYGTFRALRARALPYLRAE